jgi:hypothetical protein
MNNGHANSALDTALGQFLRAYGERPDLIAHQEGWSPSIELRATDSAAVVTMLFVDGRAQALPGRVASPTLVVSSDERTLCEVLRLERSPNEPYLFGELTVRGAEADFVRLDYIASELCPQ